MNLKNRDKKLLYEFCSNSRSSYSSLGKKARMSQQLVSYKIKAMQDNGLIAFSYPLIDYSRFGLLQFQVHFRVNYRSKRTFNSLVDKLAEHDSVVEITDRGGKYDLVVTFSANNPSYFNKTLKQLVEENPDQLKDYMILTSVVSHYFPKKYMIGLEDNTRDIIIGGDREIVKINETEKNVLRILVEDSRSRTVDIASKASINPRTAIAIIKRLKQTGILHGFSSILNTGDTGFLSGVMLLRFHNLSLEAEERFREFCITSKNITEMHKLFGNYDMAVMIEAENAVQLRSVHIKIREMFENIINDSDSFRIYSVHKRAFLPRSFF